MADRNHRITFARSPKGLPVPEDFGSDETAIPTPGPGQFLSRTIWLSLDPYYRNVMKNSQIYADRLAPGDVMVGETVAQVMDSRHPEFRAGEYVAVRNGWQQYALSSGQGVRRIDPAVAPVSTALGVLGMPGMTAYFGLLDVGQPKPGETIIVSAASGAVGQVVGQIGKIMGCRVVGIAGGARKCAFVRDELGFDAAVDYKAEKDLGAALKAAAPRGVDIYFDNVGGDMLTMAAARMRPLGRILLCGQIATYDSGEAIVAPPIDMMRIIYGEIRMQGFLVTRHADLFGQALADLAAWNGQGLLAHREDVRPGLKALPETFAALFTGANIGTLLGRISDGSGVPL